MLLFKHHRLVKCSTVVFAKYFYFCATIQEIMKVFRDADTYNWRNVVVTTGTFDGVHRGHRYLLNELRREADKLGSKSVVVSFEPHPRLVLNPDNTDIMLLNSMEEKAMLLEQMGIDGLYIIPFTIPFSSKSSETFFKEYLVDKLHTASYVMGHDHSVGNKKTAKEVVYEQLGEKYGVKVDRVEAAEEDDHVFSSSKVRTALEAGDLSFANKLLGYSYLLSGTVERGKQLGRKIGFPTANICPTEERKLIPKEGVYAVYVYINQKKYKGVLNVGYRPTVEFSEHHQTIEAHIIGFEGDLYDENLMLSFEHRIRNEKRFDNLEALQAQITIDKSTAEQILTL